MIKLCIAFYSLLPFGNPAPLELLLLDTQAVEILMVPSNTVAQTPFIEEQSNPQRNNRISKEQSQLR